MNATENESRILQAIVGEKLSSVEFIEDYVQLRFDGATLTAYTRPTLHAQDTELSWGEPGYRDRLCDLIRNRVIEANIRIDDALELRFESSAIVRVSLRAEDYRYRGAEAVLFRDARNETFTL